MAFLQNSELINEEDIKKAVHRGRYVIKELVGVIQLKKYRTIRRRYDEPDEDEGTQIFAPSSAGAKDTRNAR